MLFRIQDSTRKTAEAEYQLLLDRENHKLQEEHFKTIQLHIAESKQAEFDLLQHLSAIRAYAAADENDRLDFYLSEYIEALPGNMDTAYCENFAVNAVLQYYISMADKDNIETDVHTVVPLSTGISDTDLCIVFGNSIENAIEACRRFDGERFIKINSKIVGKNLAITIDNSFDGIVDEKDGVFFSRKRDDNASDKSSASGRGEGIGISSVKAVAAKYDATARFEADGNVFKAMILLRVEEK